MPVALENTTRLPVSEVGEAGFTATPFGSWHLVAQVGAMYLPLALGFWTATLPEVVW